LLYTATRQVTSKMTKWRAVELLVCWNQVAEQLKVLALRPVV